MLEGSHSEGSSPNNSEKRKKKKRKAPLVIREADEKGRPDVHKEFVAKRHPSEVYSEEKKPHNPAELRILKELVKELKRSGSNEKKLKKKDSSGEAEETADEKSTS